MDNNMKNGQINNGPKNVPTQVQGNKSIWKDQSFRKGVMTGAGCTAGAMVLYLLGKVGFVKVKTLIQARREKRAAEAAAGDQPGDPKK